MSTAPNETTAAAQALTQAAGRVASAKVDFDRLSRGLNDQIVGMAARWQGAGGLAFQNLQAAWQEKQATIVSALNEFEASLVSTDRDFTATDDVQATAANANIGRLHDVPTI
jgi:WXG100 family type VII secretion target